MKYNFFASDHLGNNRVVLSRTNYSNDAKIEQATNYYAYGGIMDDVATGADVQTHKYNGNLAQRSHRLSACSPKGASYQTREITSPELDRMHGLDWYDYSARQYDATIGQFTSMDPLCEKYYHISPYVYCAGNPIKYVDPDGGAVKIAYVDKYGRNQVFTFRDTGQTGIVRVPKSQGGFVKKFVQAYYYNKNNYIRTFGKNAKTGLMKLVQRKVDKNTVVVRDGSNTIDKNYYSHRQNTLYWTPGLASRNSNGITESPATIQTHEGAHANNNTESVESSQAYYNRINKTDEDYKDAEERSVIQGDEQHQAEANGEVNKGTPVRTDHEGKYYKTVKNVWEH